MNHVKTKTSGKRWWWVALVCSVVVVVSMLVSSSWCISWTNTRGTADLILEKGSIVFLIGPPYGSSRLETQQPARFGDISVQNNTHGRWALIPHYLYKNNDFGIVFGIELPLYFLLVALLLFLMLPFVKKHHRRKHGLCVKCAYDLTGNESGTCSECGTALEKT